MTRKAALEALRAQGIRNPSPQLIEDYMRVQQAEEWVLEVPSPSLRPDCAEAEPETRPHPASESNLEPLLRSRGELQKPAGRRKGGRPRIQAIWFPCVARAMANDTPLRLALSICGIHGLSAKELRSLYRSRALCELRERERQKWEREGGMRYSRRTHRACKGGLPLGMSPELRRIL